MVDKKENVMQDWAGTIFHEGDTVVFTLFMKQIKFSEYIFRDPITHRLLKPRVVRNDVSGFGWDPYWESEIVNVNGILWAELPPDETGASVGVPINLIWDEYKENDLKEKGHIFCIKGISDKHEEFFKHFLRENVSGDN